MTTVDLRYVNLEYLLDVFVCHSPSDDEVAACVAARLEHCAEAKVWMEQLDPGSLVTSEWEGGLSSAAIVLVLGPDAVPRQVRREEWEPILTHRSTRAQPPIACVLTHPCAYPPLLARNNFFHWSSDPGCLRALDRWVLGLHENAGARSFAAAHLPSFEQRPAQMEVLWRTLADDAGRLCLLTGQQGAGKSTLAQEFARVAGDQFREVLWISCGESSDAFILGELGAQLGVQDIRQIPDVLREHRLLTIFDDVRRPLPAGLADVQGRCSVLVTTRDESVAGGLVVNLEAGNFPISEPAIAGAALRLWEALSVCRRDGSNVALAARIAGLQQVEAEAALKDLIEARAIDPMDVSRVRVCRPIIAHTTVRARHAEALLALLPQCLSELPSALEFACGCNWDLARRLGQHAADMLRLQSRTTEAAEVLDTLLSKAETAGHLQDAQHFRWELSWIRDDNGHVRLPTPAEQQVQLKLAL